MWVPVAACAAVATMAVWLLVAGWHDRSLTKPEPGWTQTRGTVVGIYSHRVRGMVYAPVIAFTDPAGGRHVFRAPTSSDASPPVGSTVSVAYNPAKPADAHDLSATPASWEWPFYTGLLLLVLCGAATVLGVRTRMVLRRQRGAERGALGEEHQA